MKLDVDNNFLSNLYISWWPSMLFFQLKDWHIYPLVVAFFRRQRLSGSIPYICSNSATLAAILPLSRSSFAFRLILLVFILPAAYAIR
ncbi:hypothetical protein ACCN85_000834 [Escherichia coli]